MRPFGKDPKLRTPRRERKIVVKDLPREPEWDEREHVDMEECDACGGDGVSGHDCGEDTCCCLNPDDNITCQTCNGTGWV